MSARLQRVVSLLLAIGCCFAASARAQSWTDVIATDMRFKIEMPAPVERKSVTEKEAAYAGPRSVYQSSIGAQNFDFDHVDYTPEHVARRGSKEMVRDLGRGAVETAFPKSRFKYLRDEAVTIEGWEGYALDIEGEGGDGVMMRTWLVKNRLYRLLVTFGPDEPSKAAARRFLGSFRVAETQ
jgi:hypothetical protein